MRILHTSDWHIGRSFHGHSTMAALGDVLGELVEQVRANDVDVVIVAGDVFDSSAPAGAAYALLSDTLRALAETAAVIVTSGNHDNAARLGFQSGLLRDGIHVVTDPGQLDLPLTIADEHGEVDFYGIPYLEPSVVRSRWEGVDLRTQAQTMTHAMNLVRASIARRGVRSVAIAHCFAAGVEATGVEREVRRGTLDVVPLAAFDGPDYVALGHIHGRNKLSERVRYSGAPLHYGFGEKDKQRGSWLIDLDAAELADVQWLPLPVPRRLAVVRGTFEELLQDPRFDADTDAWVAAIYTDRVPQRDAMRRLQHRFVHCATVTHEPLEREAITSSSYGERLRNATTDEERIEAFLTHVRAGEGASTGELLLLREVMDDFVRAEALA